MAERDRSGEGIGGGAVMTAEALYNDPALVEFYDLHNGWAADFERCAVLAEGAQSVLDLGCGTGEFAAFLARRRDVARPPEVVGVDPAAAMLDIAHRREGGDRVAWIEGDGRTIRLGRRFDLVVLTGHAFQVFLADDDQLAVLNTIAAHLTPGGQFVFDSRNPCARVWENWARQGSEIIDHPDHGETEKWGDAVFDAATGIVTYETHFRIVTTGEHRHSSARIRFASQDHIARRIEAAGLRAETWLGSWEGAPFCEHSPEIIPIGRLA